jgi:hypothetical protein
VDDTAVEKGSDAIDMADFVEKLSGAASWIYY